MPRLADVMRPELIEAAPEDTLGEVAERMTAVNVGAVIVKDYGRLIGILTERDMLKAMAARVHTSEARVRQWMTEEPITAASDMEVEEAARIMLDNGFRHLPVVDESGQVTGVVSLRRVVAATNVASAWRASSEPARPSSGACGAIGALSSRRTSGACLHRSPSWQRHVQAMERSHHVRRADRGAARSARNGTRLRRDCRVCAEDGLFLRPLLLLLLLRLRRRPAVSTHARRWQS